MKFEDFSHNEHPNPEKNKNSRRPGNKKEKEEVDSDRRKVLKGLFGAAAGAAAVGSGFDKFIKPFSEEEDKENKNSDPEKDRYRDEISREEKEPTQEQKEIEQENVRSLTEVLDFHQEGKIELNTETMEAIKNHWKEKYKNDPDLKNSLEQAYYQMGAWEEEVKQQFRQKGVPEKFAYLAIPESHWQTDARSPDGASGPYQFMPKTGKSYGLNTGYYREENLNIDERRDPVRSAQACAELLQDLYQAGEDWDLALSGYNGNYLWRYLKHGRQNDEEISYENFLQFMEDKLNRVKEEVKSQDYHYYEIQTGDNLRKIALKSGMDVNELCRINDIQDPGNIYAGETIKIPIKEKNKEKMFQEKISDLSQNLNYPPKFNAVHELIQEGFVTDQRPEMNYTVQKTEETARSYTFQKGDQNLYRLAKNKFSDVDYRDIVNLNPKIDPNNIRPGDQIKIPASQNKNRLRDFARSRSELQKLKELNPAVKDPKKPLPSDYEIRVPATKVASSKK